MHQASDVGALPQRLVERNRYSTIQDPVLNWSRMYIRQHSAVNRQCPRLNDRNIDRFNPQDVRRALWHSRRNAGCSTTGRRLDQHTFADGQRPVLRGWKNAMVGKHPGQVSLLSYCEPAHLGQITANKRWPRCLWIPM